jgi:hypothetical protein
MSEPSPDPYREAPPPPPIVFESTPAERARLRARIGVAIGILPLVAYGGCQVFNGKDGAPDGEAFFGILWLVSLPLCLVGIGFGFDAWIKANRERKPLPLSAVAAVFLGFVSPIATFLHGLSTFSYSRGRQLVRRGVQRLPELTPGEHAGARLSMPPDAVEGWLKNAQTEVASVAAFTHLANELLSIGAPARLIQGALRAAQEEVEHAELCFALAGRPYAAGTFPEATWSPDRAPTPESIASECVVSACVLERASAIVAERLSSRADVPVEVKRVLERIAVEEASHAEHGWDVIAHYREHGDRRSIDLAMRRAIMDLEATKKKMAGYDGLEQYGLPSAELWREAIEAATRDTRTRLGFADQSGAMPDQLVGSRGPAAGRTSTTMPVR